MNNELRSTPRPVLAAVLILAFVLVPFQISSKNKGVAYVGTELNYEDIFSPYQGNIYGGGLLLGVEVRNLNLQFGLYYDELYGDNAEFYNLGNWDYNAWLISTGMNLRWNFNPNQPVIIWADAGFKAGTGLVNFKHSDQWGNLEFNQQPITTSSLYTDLGVDWNFDKHWRIETGLGIGVTSMFLESQDYHCDGYCCDCNEYDDYDSNSNLISYYFSSRAFLNLIYKF